MEVHEADNVAEFKRRFDNFVNEFISKSQNHCIVTREKASRIFRILKGDPSVDDPQLRYYVKQKQFQLRDFPQHKLKNVLCVPTSNSRKNTSRANESMFGKYHRVALKDEFFNTIFEIHTQEGSHRHLGYKSTIQEINRHHAHIPRAVVMNFIWMCPLCRQCPDDPNLLSSGDLSQSSNESNANHFPQDCFEDVKPDIEILSKSISHNHFAGGQHQDQPFTNSSSSHPFGTSLQYSPAPPPSATQWGNSLHRQNKNRKGQEVIEANHFMAVGKVSIIDIQEFLNLSSPPSQYTCLVHYIDLWSKYSVLWPLRVKDIDDLAFGIAKNVFAYFGSPKMIIYDTNFDEAQQLEESLRKWSKQVKVTVAMKEPVTSSGPVHWKIMNKLKELLVESWEVKLSKLQYISNTKLVTTHEHISPFKAVTGNDPMTETFAELADKYNVHPDTLQTDFISSTQMPNNIPAGSNLLEAYSVYPNPDSTPVISNVCHINLTDSPIAPPADSGQQMEPTPMVNTMDISEMSKQMGTSMMDRKLSHNSGPVSSLADHYTSLASPSTSADVHSLGITNTIEDDDDDDVDDCDGDDVGDDDHHMIYIDDDDDDEEEEIDMKNIALIEDFHSTGAPPLVPENPVTEHRVENHGTNNVALLEDFTSTVPPLASQNYPNQLCIQDKDTKDNIMLVTDFNSTEQQPSTSDNSTPLMTDESVSELDKLPRLAQSFRFPSLYDNREEDESSPNPTDLETSLATSLSDCGQPYLTKSAQNVIDKYKLRAKIQNTAQMKATRCDDKPSHSKRKVHQQPLQCSLEISKVSSRQAKQRMLHAIASEYEERRKAYWRRMKQRARARMSDEQKESLNQRRRQRYAERKMTYYYNSP